jgi:hypothetical protein
MEFCKIDPEKILILIWKKSWLIANTTMTFSL